MKRKVVLTGTNGAISTEEGILYGEELKQKFGSDVEFEYLFSEAVDDDTFIERAKGAEIIVDQYQFMSKKIYDALTPTLKGFVSLGIGYNSANLPEANAHNVYVCNVSSYCLEEVALHTASLILASARRLNKLAVWVSSGKWSGGQTVMSPAKRFSKSIVGLYGFGRIARVLARDLSGFNCRIIAYDPFLDPQFIRDNGAEPVDFDTLLAESDYLSTHVPLIPGTEGAFGIEQFRKMKPTSIFINTSRGALCNVNDLYQALTDGTIAGAAIDAFITEPPTGVEAKIKDLPNVIATPHVGYFTDDSLRDLNSTSIDIAVQLMNDQMPATIINKELWVKNHA